MTQQLIVNTPPGSGVGDPATTAFSKVNSNFTELYTTLKQSAAEAALGVAPVNYGYAPGVVDRYGTNAVPGTTNMTTAIATAILVVLQQGGGDVIFLPGADYFVVPSVGGPTGLTAFTISSASNITFRGRARIVSNTTVLSIPAIFLLQDCNQITFDGLRFYDKSANIAVDFQGPWGVYVTTTTANDCGGITLRDVEAQNMLGPFVAALTTGTGRVRGISFQNLKIDSCYYGPNFQENGDGVFGYFSCNNVRRAYYPYGVSGHDLTLDVWHDSISVAANSALVIKRYKRDTSGIKLRVNFHGSLVWGNLVNFETQSVLANLGITAYGAITAGSGYTNGWYANVPATGGNGTGATFTVEVVGGTVVGVFPCQRGNGYLAGDSLSATTANLGGTMTTPFSVLVSAVGGSIYDCDVDIDLSGAPFPDPTLAGNTPFPVQFRSYTPGGSINTTTTDQWDNITVRGNFGDWSFEQPGQTPQAVNIVSQQTGSPGRLHLGGDQFGNFGGDSQVYPGFVVRTAANTDIYTKLGDLTAAPMFIDLSKYDGHAINLKVTIHAVLNNHSGANAISNEYNIIATKVGGNAPANITVASGLANSLGASPDVPSFAASGSGINVSHTNFNNALSYCMMKVEHLGRFAT